MTFETKEFSKRGDLVYYKGRSVGRFRSGGWGAFKKFLVKNFTPAEYFYYRDHGLAPLDVLHLKGYISPIRRRLIEKGLAEEFDLRLLDPVEPYEEAVQN